MSDYDQRPLNSETTNVTEHRRLNGVDVKAVTPYQLDTLNSILTPGGAGFLPYGFDSMNANYTSNTDIYTFYANGTLIMTLTVVYTDSSKAKISSVART